MTENLLQKLEEKMMMILSEVEDLRKEVQFLQHENASLKLEKEKFAHEKTTHEKKLQDLLSLFDAVKAIDNTVPLTTISNVKPVLVQEAKEG